MSDDHTSTDDRRIYIANQIARNLATMKRGAIAAVADHIASFWDPRMKARIDVLLEARRSDYSPDAASAVESLRAGIVASQTPATQFNAVDQDGRCDTG